MTTLALTFLAVTNTFSLPTGLLSAVCFVESGHKPTAMHKDDGHGNSVGLCQIKIGTAKLLGFKGTEKDLLNPNINAYYSGKYLSKQLTRYNGNAKMAIAAYNAGTCRWNSSDMIVNRKYVSKVYIAWAQNR